MSATLASRLSWGVLTPKRGMQVGAKLGLCVVFFTPMICDIGLFFFSFSLDVGERISTSCCFSAANTHSTLLNIQVITLLAHCHIVNRVLATQLLLYSCCSFYKKMTTSENEQCKLEMQVLCIRNMVLICLYGIMN